MSDAGDAGEALVQGDGSATEQPVAAGPAADSASTEPAPVAPARRGGGVFRVLWEWSKSLLMALGLFFVVRSFLVEAFKIPSGSMEGTLLVGDFLLVNKLVYGAEVPFTNKHLPAVRQPRVGDVLVFKYPLDLEKNYVKRLVGGPGDTLAMRRGRLVRNGVEQVEPYANHVENGGDGFSHDFAWQRDFLAPGVDAKRYRPSRNDWGPLVVPTQHYFVLGDNRDKSEDSRYWGFVPDSLVRGSPIVVYYSYSPDTASAFDWITRVRWARLGDVIR